MLGGVFECSGRGIGLDVVGAWHWHSGHGAQRQSGSPDLEELGSRLSPPEAACLCVSGMFTVRKEPGWLVTGGKGSDGQAPQRKQAAGGVACPSHGLESLA